MLWMFLGSGIYYFIVTFILFYCVESKNKSIAAGCFVKLVSKIDEVTFCDTK